MSTSTSDGPLSSNNYVTREYLDNVLGNISKAVDTHSIRLERQEKLLVSNILTVRNWPLQSASEPVVDAFFRFCISQLGVQNKDLSRASVVHGYVYKQAPQDIPCVKVGLCKMLYDEIARRVKDPKSVMAKDNALKPKEERIVVLFEKTVGQKAEIARANALKQILAKREPPIRLYVGNDGKVRQVTEKRWLRCAEMCRMTNVVFADLPTGPADREVKKNKENAKPTDPRADKRTPAPQASLPIKHKLDLSSEEPAAPKRTRLYSEAASTSPTIE